MRRRTPPIAVALLAGSLVVAGCSGNAFAGLTPKVPADYKPMFMIAAKRCPGVLTPQGLAAQAKVESGFNRWAQSPAGAQGIMQIIPDVWSRYGTDANGDGTANPFTASDSIATAAKYNCALDAHARKIGSNVTELRLASYNAGPGSIEKYGDVPPYPETQAYVEKVLEWTKRFAPQFAGTKS